MLKFVFIIFSFLTVAIFGIHITDKVITADANSSVAEVLNLLEDTTKLAYADTINVNASAEYGRALVHEGIIQKAQGGKTKIQSKHFVCTSCHNVKREDPDLSISDPQARLNYTNEKGLPFLPGTTLYGAVNRTSFYNGDYEKKYGDLVKPARNNIREAIQLCAVECSQGRKLEPWELESVLAYLWTIELKLEDLNLSKQAYEKVNQAINNEASVSQAIELIKNSYLSGSPATFVTPPEDRKTGYNLVGNPANGELLYNSSCKHCHENGRYSQFELDDSPFTFRFMEKHIPRYTRYSLYQVGRYGTSPKNGKRAYMPNFTSERMSNQQMEDLRAYLETKAR